MKRKIVHIITRSTFVVGYINYMNRYIPEYDHFYLILKGKYGPQDNIDCSFKDKNNFVVFSSYVKLAFLRCYREMLKEADKVIVSGLFGVEQSVFFWPQKILDKVYLQFWGGDFYQFREKVPFFSLRFLFRVMLRADIMRARGVIFLLDEEYEEFKKITKMIPRRVFTAPVPDNPKERFPFHMFRNSAKSTITRIVVGNSATRENCHAKAFEVLSKYSNEDIEVVCPLSYGDEKYRNEIISLGESIFGKKFYPLLNMLPQQEYFELLSSCDIGIYANNRQQGGGNIAAMLRMGKKVFLDMSTSLARSHRRYGFVLYDINDISKLSFKQFVEFDKKVKETNERISDDWYSADEMKSQWLSVFES